MDECKLLIPGEHTGPLMMHLNNAQDCGASRMVEDRILHLSTFQLNLSRFRHETHPKHPIIPPDAS